MLEDLRSLFLVPFPFIWEYVWMWMWLWLGIPEDAKERLDLAYD